MGRYARFLRHGALSAAIALAILVVLEIILRLFAPQLPRVVGAPPPRALPDSVLSYRYRPNSTAHMVSREFSVQYNIDEMGMRQRDRPFAADSNAARILVIGDSFTFGAANQENDTWVRVTERALRSEEQAGRGINVELVNAGVEGYDTRSELLWLEELAPKIRPAIVVLGFVTNDLYTNRPVSEPPAPELRTRQSAGFGLQSVALAKRVAMKSDFLYAKMFLLSQRRKYYAATPDPVLARQIDITRALVHEMAAYCRSHAIELIIVSIPQQYAVVYTAHHLHPFGLDFGFIDAQLAPAARADGVTWLDALPRLAAVYGQSPRKLYYRFDGHLAPEGNRVLGELVAATLGPRARDVTSR
jgi:lysophospholipase L1-like esterase